MKKRSKEEIEWLRSLVRPVSAVLSVIIFLIIGFLSQSCSTTTDQEFRKRANRMPDCRPELVEERANFVLSCIDKAKTEDTASPKVLIRACNLASKDVYCIASD